jgi:hypothetical protein
MKIEEFTKKKEFLYHLTDKDNLEKIKAVKELLSTEAILNLSSLDENERNEFLSQRRKNHEIIKVGEDRYHIRDQRPISLLNLVKCLTTGFSVKDFFRMLNNRVFFWPTLHRLNSHYKRYSSENPVIIKVSTEELLEINPHSEFCRLNSGATRSNSHLKGAPPERGNGTFLPAEEFKYTVGKVAEVTFPGSCKLPGRIYIGKSPEGPWEEVIIS